MISIKTCSTRIIVVQSWYCQVRFTPGSQFTSILNFCESLDRSISKCLRERVSIWRRIEGEREKERVKKEKEIGFEERPVPPCLLHPVDLETSWQTEEEVATASFEIRGRDCAMLRNTMTSERPLSDTLPHPRGSSLSRRIREKEEDERRGRRQKEMENREKNEKKKKNHTNQCVVASSISLPLVYLLFIFSLSFSFSSFPPFLSIFLSFSPWSLCIFRRMSACPTDEFIFVHAFRLHRQEIYARIAVRGKLLSAAGIIHTSRSLDEELTTGDAFLG